MAPLRQRACLCILMAALAGCDSAHRLSWTVAFRHAEDEARATRVEARLHDGGCDGAAIYTATLGEPGTVRPPRLDRGRYGFAGRALDRACAWFATGCVELELPPPGSHRVRVELERDPRPLVADGCPTALCGGATCQPGADAGCEGGAAAACPFGSCAEDVCSGTETTLAHGNDTSDGDRFGYAVDVEGRWALAGAPYADNLAGTLAGEVHVLERDPAGWLVRDVLVPADARARDYFGLAVALDRDRALVGAPQFDSTSPGPGIAYVFDLEAGEWTERTPLTAPEPERSSRFGFAVALWGDTAIVGAPAETGPPALVRAGAAYVFHRDPARGTWSGAARLSADDPQAEDFFGRSVALEGPRAAVGSIFDDGAAVNAGAVYVFRRGEETWVREAKLVADDPAANDELGWSVAISGTRIAASTRAQAGSRGAVYLFEDADGMFRQTAKIVAPAGQTGDRFGSALALVGNLLLVGAEGTADDGREGAGRAFLFQRLEGRWSLIGQLHASDLAADASFGWSAALTPGVAVLGALRDGPDGDTRGGAYFFELIAP